MKRNVMKRNCLVRKIEFQNETMATKRNQFDIKKKRKVKEE